VAQFLADHELVTWVSYPGLANHPTHARAKRYLDGGFGGVLSFGVRGGAAAASRVASATKLFSLLANVGDAKSLIIHPWTTTHEQLSDVERAAAGVTADLVRLSVGIEDVDDLLRDLDQALRRGAAEAA
jgi:O-acetylhomoserine/O-acetylserine sulfhydrylase-like pyridoxal-dependent enzyme